MNKEENKREVYQLDNNVEGAVCKAFLSATSAK
jgi:hypothetical protein